MFILIIQWSGSDLVGWIQVYEEQAAKDKLRYEAEMKTYKPSTVSSPTTSSKPKKSKGTVKVEKEDDADDDEASAPSSPPKMKTKTATSAAPLKSAKTKEIALSKETIDSDEDSG